MDEAQEQQWVDGNRAAWVSILRLCLRNLDYPNTEEFAATRLIVEREEAIAELRHVCAEHGDNDWQPDLHLADIIQKHLSNHLD